MPASLSSLVDNLSEINKIECKTCMEGENIKSGCDFVGLKNNNLCYKCKECDKIWQKSSLSLVDNLSGINKKECKACIERKRINQNVTLLGYKLSYKCKECNKRLLKPVNELIKKFSRVYRLSKCDLNKFVLLLRKGIYFYKCFYFHYQIKKAFSAN